MSRGKVLVAKVGLDGHDVGSKVIARLLRDAGFEVIYLGIRQTSEAVVQTALDEDVDVIGLSVLSGSQVPLTAEVISLLTDEPSPPAVVVGGVIPPEDHAALIEMGVAAVFTAAATEEDIIAELERLAGGRELHSP